MDSTDLTREQYRAMHGTLHPSLGYLSRMVERMEKTGFPPEDRLYQAACRARG